jgi:hypothetical protein
VHRGIGVGGLLLQFLDAEDVGKGLEVFHTGGI